MERKEFREELFRIALELGCAAAETFYEESESFSASVLKGELDRYSVAEEQGINLRVNYNGKNGYAYTESFDNPDELVKRAIDNASVIEDSDEHPMLPEQHYETIPPRKTPLDLKTPDEKISLAKEIEKKGLSGDKRIIRSQGSEVETGFSRYEIHNTLGLCAERETNNAAIFLQLIAQENDIVKDGYAVRTNERTDDIEGLVSEAIEDTTFKLSAQPVPTGTYRVLLKNRAAATFLSPFVGMFSAEEAQKGRSKLAGKENTKIASEIFTLIDDPFHPHAPRAFDGEGFPSRKKALIENGVFKTLLHNTKTAKKAGVESTGNASRRGYSPVGIGPTNLIVQKGSGSYEDMLAKLNNGLMVDSFGGLHVGMNPISGDFSIMAGGALVENGHIVRAVDRITIAGNLFELLNNIEAIGEDSEFGMFGPVESPSIIIRSMAVAGA
jgi:PmbA protein